jgi:hypothetical protein
MIRLDTLFVVTSFALAGCGGPTGDLTILLEAEDSITEGLEPGTELENIADGWTVRFSRYLMAIGDVHIERTSDEVEVVDDRVVVFDLSALGASGATLTELEAIDATRWDRFTYAQRGAAGAERDASAEQADFDEMVENDWTHLIEGTLTNDAGDDLAFRFGVRAPATYGPCQAEDGLSGVTVTQGGTTATVTIHGDHLFFDTFPTGAEVVERRAQWLADADTDGDRVITEAELTAADAGELFPSSTYNLAGAPFPIDSGFDFVRAQLMTQGHFQGEGECPWTPEE